MIILLFRMSTTFEKKNVNPRAIEQARMWIEEGRSKRQTAEQLCMPEFTLRKRLEKETVAQSLGSYKCTFSSQMGLEFLDYGLHLDAMFFGITVKIIRPGVWGGKIK